MAMFVALLRAINVGGTGKLAMSELVRLCEDHGLRNAETYIQSGNVIFESKLAEAGIKTKLERALAAKLGKPVGVMVRAVSELADVLAHNPFPEALPNQLVIWFLDAAPAPSALEGLKIVGRESVRAVGREVFVHYPDGIGKSKLKLPFSDTGTGRNLNTVTKLVELAQKR